jgi:hypothetical protein
MPPAHEATIAGRFHYDGPPAERKESPFAGGLAQR